MDGFSCIGGVCSGVDGCSSFTASFASCFKGFPYFESDGVFADLFSCSTCFVSCFKGFSCSESDEVNADLFSCSTCFVSCFKGVSCSESDGVFADLSLALHVLFLVFKAFPGLNEFDCQGEVLFHCHCC